jgi:hypothetical protein
VRGGEEVKDQRAGVGAGFLEVGVAGIGERVDSGVGDAVGEQRGVGGGVEQVVACVEDQGGCADAGQEIPGVVPAAGRRW